MSIRKIDKNIGTVPVWGDEDFDERVHENFVSFKEIIPRLDNSIDDINEAIVVIDNASQTVNQKAQEVSQNAQTVNQKAQEVIQEAEKAIQNAQEVIQEAEEAIQNAQTVNQKAQEVSQNAQNVADNTHKAYLWANNPYNTEVEEGYFSAKHWATVAQNVTNNNPVSAAQLEALNQKINISDIKDSLTSTDTTKPLSANQGKVLKELIDNINTIITSDDTTLDQMQEVVNFIKQNKTDLQNLDLSNIAETTTLKHFTATLLTKLNGIAENANNYSHPSTHDASMITESTTKRFVSDTEKATWNAKLDASSGTPAGTIIIFAAITAPAGTLKANGALVSRTAYSALFAAIGTTFGAGDGSTTFALPDLRAYFPRGWDDGRGIDVGRVFGSTQQDDFKSHNHNVGIGTGSYSGGTTATIAQFSVANGAYSSGNSGGTETRPKNIALLYCIKY